MTASASTAGAGGDVTWLTVKEAAWRAGVSAAAMTRWCQRRWVESRRLAGGYGPWRVAVDAHGLPVDGPCARRGVAHHAPPRD